MKETLKVAVLVFLMVLIPITLWNAGQFYLAESCDPKFGCLGVFKLLTLVVSVCAIISALAIAVAHYVFVGRFERALRPREKSWLLAGCFLISVASGSAIPLAEAMEASTLVIGWALVSFLVGAVIFTFRKK
jgi:uncharacterized membrane protein